MAEERVTIRQLARLSGVSIGTVSRALNGYADVNPDTRERIVRLARELDYTPAAAARSLVTQRSHVIGVFLETGEGHPDLQHPFFHEVLVGVKNAIGAGGYDLLLFASERPGNGYGEHSYLKRARHHNVEGVVLFGVDPDDAEVRRLVRSEMACVGVDVELIGPKTEYVISDSDHAAPGQGGPGGGGGACPHGAHRRRDRPPRGGHAAGGAHRSRVHHGALVRGLSKGVMGGARRSSGATGTKIVFAQEEKQTCAGSSRSPLG
jgi:transcriptional regulator with XRE-family HTH domain